VATTKNAAAYPETRAAPGLWTERQRRGVNLAWGNAPGPGIQYDLFSAESAIQSGDY